MRPKSGRYREIGRTGTAEVRLELYPNPSAGQPQGVLSGDFEHKGKPVAFLSPLVPARRGLVVTEDRGVTVVKTDVRFGDHNYARGPWGTAEIRFTSATRARLRLKCANRALKLDKEIALKWKDRFYRDLVIEIDRIAASRFPKAVKFRGKQWNLKKVFAAAGLKARIVLSDRNVPDEPDGWTEGELNAAMAQFRAQQRDPWTSYVFVTSYFYETTGNAGIEDTTLGIMFDWKKPAQASDPPREGCAVFASAIRDTFQGQGTRRPSAVLEREYVMTLAHEIGHTLNLVHSFEKDRADSLSLMNYPEEFTYGEDAYYRGFDFAFDALELLHLRHHSRTVTEPGFLGGVTFGFGAFRRAGDAEVPPPPPDKQLGPKQAKRWQDQFAAKRKRNRQLLLRGLALELEFATKQVFVGEPLYGIVTLTHSGAKDVPSQIRLATSLDWSTRRLKVETRRQPGGPWRQHVKPVLRCTHARRRAIGDATKLSVELPLVEDQNGEIFNRPGSWDVRVSADIVYQGQRHRLFSPVKTIEVTAPTTDRDRSLQRLLRMPGVRKFLVLRGGAVAPAAVEAVHRIAQAAPATVTGELCRLSLAEHANAWTTRLGDLHTLRGKDATNTLQDRMAGMPKIAKFLSLRSDRVAELAQRSTRKGERINSGGGLGIERARTTRRGRRTATSR